MGAQIYTNTTGSGGRLATDFDGTNAFYARSMDLTGNADGKLGIFSLWYRFDSIGTNERVLLASGGFVNFGFIGSKLSLRALDSGSTLRLSIATTTSVNLDTLWHHILASWILGATTTHLYLDGVDDNNESTVLDGELDYTRPTWNIAGPAAIDGALSEFYFNTAEYLDLSVEANREKFISPAGKPVSLGADGSLPTGTAPIIYLPDGDASDNKGTGENFVAQGSPTPTAGPEPILPVTWASSAARGRGGRGGRK